MYIYIYIYTCLIRTCYIYKVYIYMHIYTYIYSHTLSDSAVSCCFTNFCETIVKLNFIIPSNESP